MNKLKAFIVKVFSEIKYFVLPYRSVTIEVDHVAYVRNEFTAINGPRYRFQSASMYIRHKGSFSFEKQYLQRDWYKVWVGTIPINGVDTRIAFSIRHDVISFINRNYPEWCAGGKDGIKSLNSVRV